MFRKQTICILLMFQSLLSYAQEVKERHDTLQSSKVVSDKQLGRDAGTRVVEVPALAKVISAIGEADAVKYIQSLPGVSTGAEGTSAIYVRGGNVGSNLITLDGVSLYGGSHLFGLASVYPNDVISSVNFRLGGFRGNEGNMTSSHIGLTTAEGNFEKKSISLSVNSFMLGAVVSMPLAKEKVSLLASARMSPLGPEFRALQSLTAGVLDSLGRPQAVVYDAFAKVKWLVNDKNALSFFFFNSKDSYSYCYGGYSDERIGWGNLIFNVRHEGELGNDWSLVDGVSYNRFTNGQGVLRSMSGTINNIAIVTTLDEFVADVAFSRQYSKAVRLYTGFRERFARFNPGASSSFSDVRPLQPLDSPKFENLSYNSITTIHSQLDVQLWDKLEIMTAVKLNACLTKQLRIAKFNVNVNPEFNLMTNYKIAEWMTFEATADWTTQYYHTLEGIPLGWSADLIIPTTSSCPPEHAQQFYAGVLSSLAQHRFTLGAYHKSMSNLVYFPDADKLFSSTIAGWESNVKMGSGTSQGVEILYEKGGECLDLRVAYTLSRTDRHFAEVNDGLVFPAKFDRRHILNVAASCLLADNDRCAFSLNGFYTWQAGHRETVAAGEYPSVSITGKEQPLDYFSSINNFVMPPYIRLDLGLSLLFKTRHEQTLNLGVYNVMNRQNPVSVIYDSETKDWKQVALLPVFPNFNYKIVF